MVGHARVGIHLGGVLVGRGARIRLEGDGDGDIVVGHFEGECAVGAHREPFTGVGILGRFGPLPRLLGTVLVGVFHDDLVDRVIRIGNDGECDGLGLGVIGGLGFTGFRTRSGVGRLLGAAHVFFRGLVVRVVGGGRDIPSAGELRVRIAGLRRGHGAVGSVGDIDLVRLATSSLSRITDTLGGGREALLGQRAGDGAEQVHELLLARFGGFAAVGIGFAARVRGARGNRRAGEVGLGGHFQVAARFDAGVVLDGGFRILDRDIEGDEAAGTASHLALARCRRNRDFSGPAERDVVARLDCGVVPNHDFHGVDAHGEGNGNRKRTGIGFRLRRKGGARSCRDILARFEGGVAVDVDVGIGNGHDDGERHEDLGELVIAGFDLDLGRGGKQDRVLGFDLAGDPDVAVGHLDVDDVEGVVGDDALVKVVHPAEEVNECMGLLGLGVDRHVAVGGDDLALVRDVDISVGDEVEEGSGDLGFAIFAIFAIFASSDGSRGGERIERVAVEKRNRDA